MLVLMTLIFVGAHLPLMVFARVMGDDDDDDDEDEHVSQSVYIIYTVSKSNSLHVASINLTTYLVLKH